MQGVACVFGGRKEERGMTLWGGRSETNHAPQRECGTKATAASKEWWVSAAGGVACMGVA